MDPAQQQTTQLNTASDLPPLPPPPPPLIDLPTAPNPTPQPIPTSTSNKEGEPIVTTAAKEDGDEYWENYAREIELEKEVAEMGGVEKIESGEVKVPEQLAKDMGIKPTVTEQTPIAKVVKDFTIRGVALTDDQLGVGLTKPTSSGFRWLVEWFIYQLLKAHFLIKRVGGKVLRYSPPKT
ncbi:hypothetical protein HY310_00890 [Candidatus Microgenomates bacterium]|nr:hypothetical protein [Candidatus Microgenomates bacterium]